MLFAFAYSLSYSFSMPLVKILYNHNPNISSYEILYYKSVTMIGFDYIYAKIYGVHVMDVPLEYRNVIVVRGLCGFFGIHGSWASLKYIPLYISNCIFMTGPIWTSFAACMYLKEKVTGWDVLALVFAFIGVIIINF